jgi:hypothetical protein
MSLAYANDERLDVWCGAEYEFARYVLRGFVDVSRTADDGVVVVLVMPIEEWDVVDWFATGWQKDFVDVAVGFVVVDPYCDWSRQNRVDGSGDGVP